MRLPSWYDHVPAAQQHALPVDERSGHQFLLTNRGRKRLIVSFGVAAETDHPELDWPAAAEALAQKNGWSHLAIITDDNTWFSSPELIADLEKLSDAGVFASYERTLLLGCSHRGGGYGALSLAPFFDRPVVLSFSPQSTLDPEIADWDGRFQDVLASGTVTRDAATTLDRAEAIYVFYDGFLSEDLRHAKRLQGPNVHQFAAFGLMDDVAVGMRRLGMLDSLIETAMEGGLDRIEVYRGLRARKDLYIYRRNMETHLGDRGKLTLLKAFVQSFKRRKRRLRAEEAQREAEAKERAENAGKPLPPPDWRDRGRRWPRTMGNVWSLRQDGDRFTYLSDQYEGRVIGYEERNGVTLAETPPVALAVLDVGHGVSLQRPLPESFGWHVVNEALSGRIASDGARAKAVASQLLLGQQRHAWPTMIALAAAQSGITAADAKPDGTLYTGLLSRLEMARDALAVWDKDLFVDRISLSLLAGAPNTPLDQALQHYADLTATLKQDTARVTGQTSYPRIIVSQSAGSATDGRSEVILAEGQLDVAQPALDIIVATPRYPFRLMEGMPATHDPTEQMLIDEIEALAAAERAENRRWYCPSMRQAWAYGRTEIAVDFAALGDLTLEDGPHGFALEGCENDVGISDVHVSGHTAFLRLTQPPKGDAIYVTYAWGARRDTSDGQSANRGSLREIWSRPSLMVPGRVLRRYALSGRIRLMPSDLPPPSH
ncbi:hypothetical protein [Palleronia caenipelagi]|uniref:Uncharacterized protein n=1 Tax=Palleronia caenipelagi TaxID=2489174 RepID=A0A547Q7S3_9RHOB|nr:hypothetical protein [Palleronia caenipelagi]TRD22428.1 hypothetical protein FEV53_05050 [Palleronia caenipelagi]